MSKLECSSMEVSVASIATRVASCLESFNTLHLAIADTSLQNKLTECTGRFRVWSGNIGAHQTGKKSLDYRLRGASYVMLTFANLLRDLTALLLDGRVILLTYPTALRPVRQESLPACPS